MRTINKNHNVYTIIVTYNPLNWIEKLINFLSQEDLIANTIFIDNGSNDGFLDQFYEIPGSLNFIRLNKNIGFGAANNIGIKMAIDKKAEYIFLLNQDAWLEPNMFYKLKSNLIQNRDFGIVSPMHYNSSLTKLDRNFKYYLNSSNISKYLEQVVICKQPNTLLEVDFVNAAMWLCRTEMFFRAGGFCPAFFHYGEDDEFCSRIGRIGFKIGIDVSVMGIHDREFRSEKIPHKKEISNNQITFLVNFFSKNDSFRMTRELVKLLLNTKDIYSCFLYDRILIGLRMIYIAKKLKRIKIEQFYCQTPYLY